LSTPYPIKLEVVAEQEIRDFIKLTLVNASIPFNLLTDEPLKLELPANVATVSILLNILRSKKKMIKGHLTLPDGRMFDLDEEGFEKLNLELIKVLSTPQQPAQPVNWWAYFIPEIKDFFKEINSLVRWYPRAIGGGKRVVTRNFVFLILVVVVGTGFLVWEERISGDAFVFLIGILLGYVFAFLQRFLGITTGGQ